MFFLKWKSKLDKELKEHHDHSSENAKYTSPQIQNESVSLCEEAIREQIMSSIPKYWSIMADETQDCSALSKLVFVSGMLTACMKSMKIF